MHMPLARQPTTAGTAKAGAPAPTPLPVELPIAPPVILHAALEALAEAAAVVDATGQLLACNTPFLRLQGVAARSELPPRGEQFATGAEMHTAHGERLPWGELPLARALRGEPCRDLPVRVQHPGTGRWAALRVTASPLRDAAGAVVGAMLVGREEGTSAAPPALPTPPDGHGGAPLHGQGEDERHRQRHNDVRNALQVVLTAPAVLAAGPLAPHQHAMVERLQRAGMTLSRMLDGPATPS